MALRDFSAESYAAAQIKHIRKRRLWSQKRLAERLTELLAGPPPEIYSEDDPRWREAESRKADAEWHPKWTQRRVAKLEGGLLRITIDDLLELALALDVSPLVLIAPVSPPEEADRAENWSHMKPKPGDAFRVWLGGQLVYSPDQVRQWIRGVKPLLGLGDYRTDEEAQAGRRFYLLDSQPAEEWRRIREAGEYAAEVEQSLGLLAPKVD